MILELLPTNAFGHVAQPHLELEGKENQQTNWEEWYVIHHVLGFFVGTPWILVIRRITKKQKGRNKKLQITWRNIILSSKERNTLNHSLAAIWSTPPSQDLWVKHLFLHVWSSTSTSSTPSDFSPHKSSVKCSYEPGSFNWFEGSELLHSFALPNKQHQNMLQKYVYKHSTYVICLSSLGNFSPFYPQMSFATSSIFWPKNPLKTCFSGKY